MPRIITDTMTPEDIVRIFIKEEAFRKSKIMTVAKEKYLPFLKRTKKRTAFPVMINGEQGLDYYVIFCNENYEDCRKHSPAYYTAAIYRSKHGFEVIDSRMCKQESADGSWRKFNMFIQYTYHFFERYKKRFMQNPQLQKLDLIKYFLRTNYDTFMNFPQNDPKHSEQYFFFMRDCIGLGDMISNDFAIVKTCITHNEEFSNQEEAEAFCRKILSEVKIDY